MITKYEMHIRVRYQETDAQARVHHANYITYFEVVRTEMLREAGFSYREMEESGLFLVVAEAECKYRAPAVFDDLLCVSVETVRAKGVRIENRYEVRRDGEVIATGRTLLACVDRNGKPKPIPKRLCLPE
ncbi:acyl-CoA thioesterase [Blastopirellula sp. JC732]|uniref:Acyl-CoA thioesterase n=1 Tax=Blastopirellula sediminis TaxID=2894196 RepID=A0A9X1MJ37_9BACT|nr:thioesterase family protein [Blastopirellula sediminis]MCC9609195.1 acyl-CoA thioesterase [Blastopirellula sediminis]MCC9628028.1 acyl-CoA thioesterase [Blastopirellula sediminis]